MYFWKEFKCVLMFVLLVMGTNVLKAQSAPCNPSAQVSQTTPAEASAANSTAEQAIISIVGMSNKQIARSGLGEIVTQKNSGEQSAPTTQTAPHNQTTQTSPLTATSSEQSTTGSAGGANSSGGTGSQGASTGAGSSTSSVSQGGKNTPTKLTEPTEPEELEILRKAFSDITFTATYDKTLKDWQITATFKAGSKKSETFYWCESRLLPEKELKNKSLYLSIFEDYPYGEELQDPSTYTQAQIEEFRYAGSSSTRKNDPSPATFLLDFIYSSSTRKTVEQHISKVKFLGHSVSVNDRLVKPLAAVEKRLLELKKTNKTLADFLDKDLDHLEGYNWREISDVNRKSFHSTAIAIDFLPPKLNRHIYWRWTKDQKGEKWMLVPLSNRWMPPYDMINAFEEEGFIWGGKWLVWDNMHFEYRPELLEYHRWKNKQ